MEHLRLTSHEKQALTEEDVAKRRRLRSAKSADSILSMASGFNSKRESTASQGTTIINPYAGKYRSQDSVVESMSITVLERVACGF